MDNNCIFCKIANGEIPSNFIYENDEVVAFNDINPQAPVHILVVPKQHYPTLSDVEDLNLLGALLKSVQEITKKLNIKEFRTVINTGKTAGQEVFHVHLHILANRVMLWPPG
jgi:histidine triad (HIT) family protein